MATSGHFLGDDDEDDVSESVSEDEGFKNSTSDRISIIPERWAPRHVAPLEYPRRGFD